MRDDAVLRREHDSAKTFSLDRPMHWVGGLIVASPHSGRQYPDWFVEASSLDSQALRMSEDAFVDRLIASACYAGAAVLTANVPRCVVDLNRSRDDLDPDAIQDVGMAPTARAKAGLGVIPRIVAKGRPIFYDPIPRHEAELRLDRLWQPYHDALDGLVHEALARFGQAVLIDVHSMPHEAIRHLRPAPEIVLGDLWGASADDWLRAAVLDQLKAGGYRISMNIPFAGAYILARHGRPLTGRHAIQIEIDRSLYMDEAMIRPNARFDQIDCDLARVWQNLAQACDLQSRLTMNTISRRLI